MQVYAGKSTKPLILFSSGLTFEIRKQTNWQRIPAFSPCSATITASSEPEMPQVIIRKMNARKPPNLFPHLEKAHHLLNPDQKQPAHLEVCRSAESSGFPSWQLATQPGRNLALPEQAQRQQCLQLGVRTSWGSPSPSVFSHQPFLLKSKKNQCGLFSPGPETRPQLT